MLRGPGRAEEDHVVFGGHEVQRAEVGDGVAVQAAGVVEVELLEAFAGGEAGGADAAFAAVGFPGGDLALEAGDQELLVVQPSARARSASRPMAASREGAGAGCGGTSAARVSAPPGARCCAPRPGDGRPP